MKSFLQRLLGITIICVFLLSCSSRKNRLSRVWFFTDGYTSSGKAIKISPKDSLLNNFLTPACFINLQDNGDYSCFLYKFGYGTWRVENDDIILSNEKKEEQKLSIMVLQGNEIMLGITDPKGASFNCNFESASNSFTNDLENPFSKKNNLWRITSSKKEDDKELNNRLLNHFLFWEKYFAWGIKTEQKTLDVRSTPTPIKLYGNGFTLKPFDNLPQAWKNCFFDEEDCRKANDKLEVFIRSNDIAWPHTENKYKMFLSAFQQMQQKMR